MLPPTFPSLGYQVTANATACCDVWLVVYPGAEGQETRQSQGRPWDGAGQAA